MEQGRDVDLSLAQGKVVAWLATVTGRAADGIVQVDLTDAMGVPDKEVELVEALYGKVPHIQADSGVMLLYQRHRPLEQRVLQILDAEQPRIQDLEQLVQAAVCLGYDRLQDQVTLGGFL